MEVMERYRLPRSGGYLGGGEAARRAAHRRVRQTGLMVEQTNTHGMTFNLFTAFNTHTQCNGIIDLTYVVYNHTVAYTRFIM